MTSVVKSQTSVVSNIPTQKTQEERAFQALCLQEIVRTILFHLSSGADLARCGMVNKAWREISLDTAIWKNLISRLFPHAFTHYDIRHSDLGYWVNGYRKQVRMVKYEHPSQVDERKKIDLDMWTISALAIQPLTKPKQEEMVREISNLDVALIIEGVDFKRGPFWQSIHFLDRSLQNGGDIDLGRRHYKIDENARKFNLQKYKPQRQTWNISREHIEQLEMIVEWEKFNIEKRTMKDQIAYSMSEDEVDPELKELLKPDNNEKLEYLCQLVKERKEFSKYVFTRTIWNHDFIPWVDLKSIPWKYPFAKIFHFVHPTPKEEASVVRHLKWLTEHVLLTPILAPVYFLSLIDMGRITFLDQKLKNNQPLLDKVEKHVSIGQQKNYTRFARDHLRYLGIDIGGKSFEKLFFSPSTTLLFHQNDEKGMETIIVNTEGKTPFERLRERHGDKIKFMQETEKAFLDKSESGRLDALMRFLEGQENEEYLFFLGLAPDQVKNHSEESLTCFKQVAEAFKTLPSPEQKKLASLRFKQYYPHIYQKLLKERYEEQVEQEKGVPNIYQNTFQKLEQRVIGQPQAVRLLASLLTSQQHNSSKSQVFLFVGPTGVGKTELAKAVAHVKRSCSFITFAMNQYQNEMDITKFFGAGVGYLGSSDLPPLVKQLNSCHPIFQGNKEGVEVYKIENAVILFDEFEKAHPHIKQSLLTIFDEFYLTATYTDESRDKSDKKHGGNINIKYTFEKCVIITTSNSYQEQILQAFENHLPSSEISELFKQCNRNYPTPQSYSPELLSRISVIPFGPIPRGECYQKIIQIKLDQFFKELQDEFSFKEVSVEDPSATLSFLEKKLYGNGTDLREIAKCFFNVKTSINEHKSEKWGQLQNVKLVFVVDRGKLCIKVLSFDEVYQDTFDPQIIFELF